MNANNHPARNSMKIPSAISTAFSSSFTGCAKFALKTKCVMNIKNELIARPKRDIRSVIS